ncbi:MAG TPA: hypothetical protein DIU15_14665 [Deltaproteobacteria bacterium]|nr:hypothetical protein [Deltaproteobacteria bacterium]HCP47281.1 hypothetical protein [Deltaproteobacteria bacterium]
MSTDPDPLVKDLQARIVELEMRSEEGKAEVARMEEFVTAFDGRIRSLEKEVRSLRRLLEDPPDNPPAPGEEKPPHY